MYAFLQNWLRLKTDRSGVTALEYGLIAALIAGVIIAAVATLGTNIRTTFTDLGNRIGSANTGIVSP
jgi:pilus assembly protein Flp/PilA